jgi:hypothetical protein
VDEVMVSFAQREEVGNVGWAVVTPPPADVVDPAGVEADVAVGVCAAAVRRSQRSSLGPVRCSS